MRQKLWVAAFCLGLGFATTGTEGNAFGFSSMAGRLSSGVSQIKNAGASASCATGCTTGSLTTALGNNDYMSIKKCLNCSSGADNYVNALVNEIGSSANAQSICEHLGTSQAGKYWTSVDTACTPLLAGTSADEAGTDDAGTEEAGTEEAGEEESSG